MLPFFFFFFKYPFLRLLLHRAFILLGRVKNTLPTYLPTPSTWPPSRPPKIILKILTSYFYSSQLKKKKSRDGLHSVLTWRKWLENVLKDRVFFTTFLHNDHPDKFDPYVFTFEIPPIIASQRKLYAGGGLVIYLTFKQKLTFMRA